MAENVIYKIIIEGGGAQSAGETKSNPAGDSKATQTVKDTQSADSFKNFAKKVAGFYAATSLVRNAVKTNVGLMDVYTGNDYQQRVIEGHIQIAESIVSTGIAFAINPIAGAASLASKAISLGAEARKKGVEIYTQSLEAGLVRERAGGAFNRSRIAGRY